MQVRERWCRHVLAIVEREAAGVMQASSGQEETAALSAGKVIDELKLIRERAERVDDLACIVVATEDDADELYDVLRNVSGALQVLIVYLEGQLP